MTVKNVTSFNDLWQIKMLLNLMTCDSKKWYLLHLMTCDSKKNVTSFNDMWQ